MATHAISIINWTCQPDTTGSAVFEDSNANAGIDRHPHLILALADTATKIGIRGSFIIPQNYVGTAKLRIYWLTTATTGNFLADFDYVAIGAGETYDPAADTENVTSGSLAADATARDITVSDVNITSANLAAGDIVQFFFGRDGVNESTGIAASVYVVGLQFLYNDA